MKVATDPVLVFFTLAFPVRSMLELGAGTQSAAQNGAKPPGKCGKLVVQFPLSYDLSYDLSGLETRKDSSEAKELFLKEKKLKSQWITKLRYRHPQRCSQSVPCHSHGYTGRPARRTKNYMFAA